MSQNPNLKIAHVTKLRGKGKPIISFTKLATIFVPPSVLFGAQCKLIRNGLQCRDLGIWNPRRNGIIAGELEDWDTLHLDLPAPDDFYPNLLAHESLQPGMIVSVDPDLLTAFELWQNSQAA